MFPIREASIYHKLLINKEIKFRHALCNSAGQSLRQINYGKEFHSRAFRLEHRNLNDSDFDRICIYDPA